MNITFSFSVVVILPETIRHWMDVCLAIAWKQTLKNLLVVRDERFHVCEYVLAATCAKN